jgi:hypothetical protein
MLKKFSKITGVQVGERDTDETDFTGPSHQEVLQTKVLSMIDDFLRIRSVGAARKSILPHVIIDGKEDLASAIVNLILQGENPKDKSQAGDRDIRETLLESEYKNQISKILNIVKIYESKEVGIKIKLGNLSGEELNKRLHTLDLMISSQKWEGIKSQLQKLKTNYLDRLNNS